MINKSVVIFKGVGCNTGKRRIYIQENGMKIKEINAKAA